MGEGPGKIDTAKARRDRLASAGIAIPDDIAPGAMGLAFSGGGIRSATVSLGVAQALAEKKRLLDFDYCSTVSGGGYFGSFLRGLFLPDSARGHDAAANAPSPQSQKDKSDFAHAALTADCRDRTVEDPASQVTLRNPVWWLREHSRYLAPNGSSDYFVAAAYMVRNWLAMLYVTMLPLALFALAAIGLTALLAARHGAWFGAHLLMGDGTWVLSPLWLGAAAFAFLQLGTGIGYWLTEGMSGEGVLSRHGLGKRWALFFSVLSAAVGVGTLWALYQWATHRPWFTATAPLTALVCIGVFGTLVGALIGLRYLFLQKSASGLELSANGFTAEVRRRLTRTGAVMLAGALVFAVLALVDTLGMATYRWLAEAHDSTSGLFGTLSAAALPVVAWLINKVPGWFGKDSKLAGLLGHSLWTIALLVSLVLYLSLAVGVHVLAQSVLFGDAVWFRGHFDFDFLLDGDDLWRRFAFVAAVIAALTLMTGSFTGFINLSSLHGLYAARLTRAYMGASNLARLGGASRITEADPGDQVPIEVYQQQETLAPLHLINVTLNETRSGEGSQLLERDRKGVPMVFAPEGVWLDAARNTAPYSWQQLKGARVEGLSVGQLCAISGAAASSGMGSRTTLGGSLAMTFANIRLGYWWNVQDLIRGPVTWATAPGTWLYNTVTRPLRTYFYLFNEMTSNYSRRYARLNISDGGHFENTATYELLRRRVKLIVTCDNGADPGYDFEDLELLVRKARIDLGLSINVASASAVRGAVGEGGAALFLNGDGRDWRERVRKRDTGTPDDGAYCLLLNVYDSDDASAPISRIVWLKPRLFRGVPQDVVGYARRNPDFPQESTGDQFFDEAQWESYRALGYCMMTRLLSHTGDKADVLRNMAS